MSNAGQETPIIVHKLEMCHVKPDEPPRMVPVQYRLYLVVVPSEFNDLFPQVRTHWFRDKLLLQ
jgi:hypothetical protein